MTAKELVLEHLPRWSEEQAQRALYAAEPKPEDVGKAQAQDELVPTLEETFQIFGDVEFLPREQAWH